jgi:hypothetical protein
MQQALFVRTSASIFAFQLMGCRRGLQLDNVSKIGKDNESIHHPGQRRVEHAVNDSRRINEQLLRVA